MTTTNEIRHGRHCTFNLHVHLVFVTKYRRGVFTKTILSELNTIFYDVCRNFESDLVEFTGEGDHVHLLVAYPPKVAVSALVNSLKGVFSRLVRKNYQAALRNKVLGNSLWSPSYFAGSCGGAPLTIIRQYIEQQRATKPE
jgi:putative transposase